MKKASLTPFILSAYLETMRRTADFSVVRRAFIASL